MAVTYRHLLLLALLLASPTVVRAARAAEGPATVPHFESVRCPKLQGAEWLAGANCGYLVADRSHHPAHGRETPCTITEKATRSSYLPGRRTGRHCSPGGQRAYHRRFH